MQIINNLYNKKERIKRKYPEGAAPEYIMFEKLTQEQKDNHVVRKMDIRLIQRQIDKFLKIVNKLPVMAGHKDRIAIMLVKQLEEKNSYELASAGNAEDKEEMDNFIELLDAYNRVYSYIDSRYCLNAYGDGKKLGPEGYDSRRRC